VFLSFPDLTLFLSGDVMTGRGVEPGIRDARVYVDLAERKNGVIRRPVEGETGACF
jgi:hypothetical protein